MLGAKERAPSCRVGGEAPGGCPGSTRSCRLGKGAPRLTAGVVSAKPTAGLRGWARGWNLDGAKVWLPGGWAETRSCVASEAETPRERASSCLPTWLISATDSFWRMRKPSRIFSLPDLDPTMCLMTVSRNSPPFGPVPPQVLKPNGTKVQPAVLHSSEYFLTLAASWFCTTALAWATETSDDRHVGWRIVTSTAMGPADAKAGKYRSAGLSLPPMATSGMHVIPLEIKVPWRLSWTALCLTQGPFRLQETAWSPKMSMGLSHWGHLVPASLASRMGTPSHHRKSIRNSSLPIFRP